MSISTIRSAFAEALEAEADSDDAKLGRALALLGVLDSHSEQDIPLEELGAAALRAMALLALERPDDAFAAVEGLTGMENTRARVIVHLHRRGYRDALVEIWNLMVSYPQDAANHLLRAQVLLESLGDPDAPGLEGNPVETARAALVLAREKLQGKSSPSLFSLQRVARRSDGRYAYFLCELERTDSADGLVSSATLEAVDYWSTTELQDAIVAEFNARRSASDGDLEKAADGFDTALRDLPTDESFVPHRLALAAEAYRSCPSAARAVTFAETAYAASFDSGLSAAEQEQIIDDVSDVIDAQLEVAGDEDVPALARILLWIRSRRLSIVVNDRESARCAAVCLAPISLMLNPWDWSLMTVAADADDGSLRSLALVDTAVELASDGDYVATERLRLQLNFLGSHLTVPIPQVSADDENALWINALRMFQLSLAGDLEGLRVQLAMPTPDADWADSIRAEAMALVFGPNDKDVHAALVKSATQAENGNRWLDAARSWLICGNQAAAWRSLAEAELYGRSDPRVVQYFRLLGAADSHEDVGELTAAVLDLLGSPSSIDDFRNVLIPLLSEVRGAKVELTATAHEALDRRTHYLLTTEDPSNLERFGPFSMAVYRMYSCMEDLEEFIASAGEARGLIDDVGASVRRCLDVAEAAGLDRFWRSQIVSRLALGEISASPAAADRLWPEHRRRVLAFVSGTAQAAGPSFKEVEELVELVSDQTNAVALLWCLIDRLTLVEPELCSPARARVLAEIGERLEIRGEPDLARRRPVAVVLGRQMVPSQTGPESPMMTELVPRMRSVVRERTGVELPGIGFRTDRIADDLVTVLINESVRFRQRVPVVPRDPDTGFESVIDQITTVLDGLAPEIVSVYGFVANYTDLLDEEDAAALLGDPIELSRGLGRMRDWMRSGRHWDVASFRAAESPTQ